MSRFAPIRNALTKRGWSVQSIELASDCWWAKEIWLLTSDWSPEGRAIYLSLLIDPMKGSDQDNLGDNSVWAVSLTRGVPKSNVETASFAIQINGRFDDAIQQILKTSDALRTEK